MLGLFDFVPHRPSVLAFLISLEKSIQLGATYLSERLFRPLLIYSYLSGRIIEATSSHLHMLGRVHGFRP